MKITFAVPICMLLLVAGNVLAGDPVALRVESFTVPPSTQPLAFVDVENLRDVPYRGFVSLKPPDTWRIVPARREVTLAPGEIQRVPFTVEKARNVEANSYPLQVSAVAPGATVTRSRNVVVASAPYFKPTIDGKIDDWKDAIPITFSTAEKKTVISTYWNRRRFSILVAVEEDKLIRRRPDGPFDAVQIAISPEDTRTGTSPDEETTRFEFLLVGDDGQTGGTCYQLAAPGIKLAETQRVRELGPLVCEGASLAVSRSGNVTYYECALSFTPMRSQVRPSEGREFFMSVLVHDPDGTGLRDWGLAAGLRSERRNRLAWSRFAGDRWGEKPPFDNKLYWGFCTSKY